MLKVVILTVERLQITVSTFNLYLITVVTNYGPRLFINQPDKVLNIN